MPPYNPYYNPQQMMYNEMSLQRQIENAQNQLQQMQAQRQMMASQAVNSIPVQQPVQPQGIVTQIVENFESISANAVPMDNNGAVFIKNDGSEIQARRWTADGKIQTTSYKPILAANNVNADNLPNTQERTAVGLSDDVTEAFMQRFDDISNRLDAIEQIWNTRQPVKNTVKSKKEADAE